MDWIVTIVIALIVGGIGVAAGVYFGTNTGALFASTDEGESWRCIAQHLPTILSVETLVLNG